MDGCTRNKNVTHLTLSHIRVQNIFETDQTHFRLRIIRAEYVWFFRIVCPLEKKLRKAVRYKSYHQPSNGCIEKLVKSFSSIFKLFSLETGHMNWVLFSAGPYKSLNINTFPAKFNNMSSGASLFPIIRSQFHKNIWW